MSLQRSPWRAHPRAPGPGLRTGPKPPCRRWRAANREGGEDPQPSGRSDGNTSSASSSGGRAGDLDARLAEAKAEMQREWGRLRSGLGGAAPPGGGGIDAESLLRDGAQGEDGAAVAELRRRLGRLVSGEALLEADALQRRGGQPGDGTSQEQGDEQEAKREAAALLQSAGIAVDVQNIQGVYLEAAEPAGAVAGAREQRLQQGEAAAAASAPGGSMQAQTQPLGSGEHGQELLGTGTLLAEAAEVEQAQGRPEQGQQEQQGQPEQQEQQQQEGEPDSAVIEVALRTAPMLKVAVWLVAAAQWLPVLPGAVQALWARSVAPGELLLPLLMAVPESAATAMLQLDVGAVVGGSSLASLFTCGLVNAGLAPALWCADGIANASVWLELRLGALQLLAIFLMATLGAATGQIVWGQAEFAMCAPGVCTGLYAAWLVIATTRFHGSMPISSDKGIFYTLLNVLLATHQPAVGLGSIAGGALAGALAVPLAPSLARGLALAFWLPSAVALAVARLAWETGKLAVGVVATVVMGTWAAVMQVVQAIRGM